MNTIIVLFLECELGVADASEGVDLPINEKWVDCKKASPDGQAERVGGSWVVNSALNVCACL